MQPTGDLCNQIVARVASRAGVGETDLPPLYETVDVAAIAALVDQSGRETAPVTVRFTYTDYRVTVTGPDSVTVESLDDASVRNPT